MAIPPNCSEKVISNPRIFLPTCCLLSHALPLDLHHLSAKIATLYLISKAGDCFRNFFFSFPAEAKQQGTAQQENTVEP